MLRHSRPDVVHVHNTLAMISPAIYSACHEFDIPVVQTLHNFRLICPGATFFRDGQVCESCVEKGLLSSVVHSCYRNSRLQTAGLAAMLVYHRSRGTFENDIDAYIALCNFSRTKLIAGGLPAERVFVKANFVDPDPGMRLRKPGEYALFVGRISPEKRLSTLISAWKLLRAPLPLLVLGAGRDPNASGEQGVPGIEFRGHVSRSEAIDAMKNARFLVFSSECYENFPVAIAESFACGTPVIASRLGAMAEIVDDGRTGLLFTPGNTADLAERVEWAWEHPADLQTMGEAARAEFEAKYTAEKNYPLLMDIYRKAIDRMQCAIDGASCARCSAV